MATVKPCGPMHPTSLNRRHVKAWLLGFRDGWQQPHDLGVSANVDHLANGDTDLMYESLDRGINAGQWFRSPLHHQVGA